MLFSTIISTIDSRKSLRGSRDVFTTAKFFVDDDTLFLRSLGNDGRELWRRNCIGIAAAFLGGFSRRGDAGLWRGGVEVSRDVVGFPVFFVSGFVAHFLELVKPGIWDDFRESELVIPHLSLSLELRMWGR
nr:hypothetical protein Iba_chr05cCG8500 [Ipomoea batatas]